MSHDPWRLDGQVAIVTGAGRGIGRGTAIELAAAGATVVLVSRTRADLEEVAEQIGSAAVVRPADATDPDEVAAVVAEAAELGDLRVLHPNAGWNRPGPSRDYALEDWDKIFDLNVRATFLACRAMGDHLLRTGSRGSIITMSSQMGTVGYPGRAAYCASKHAVEGMTKALAVEWAPHGIRVNAVAPTFIDTPWTTAMFEDEAFRADVLERRLPTGRLAEVQDVARAVRYLACDASENVTGHMLRIDGGWTAW